MYHKNTKKFCITKEKIMNKNQEKHKIRSKIYYNK